MTEELKYEHILRGPLEMMLNRLRDAKDSAEEVQRLVQRMDVEELAGIAGQSIRWQNSINDLLGKVGPILNIVVTLERE